jgi:dinuclear metal center YbgI/SA1388 family protein
MQKISEIIQIIEARIPNASAEKWDSVGLICGESKAAIKGVVVGVDFNEALYKLALQQKANLIVIHHPPLFPKGRGITKLTLGKPGDLNTLLLQCFQNKIAVYVAHTNFDRCALDGMIALSTALGAVPQARVWEQPEEGETLLKKLVTYIPVDHFESVRDALYMVGCGHIGNYDCCGFGSSGVGNFRPLQGASPFFGKVGELEEAEEIRFETLVVSGMEKVAIAALKRAHPYEEVAYDLYAVEQMPGMKGLVWGLGYGFVAEFKKPIPYAAFARKVKSVFKVKSFITNQVTPKRVKRIAFTPGKGSSFVKSVMAHSADVYITGEVGYHASIDAARAGLNVIELGHRESEHYFLKTFQNWFKEWSVPCTALDERTQRTV